MSKTSSKQKVVQLKEWLKTLNSHKETNNSGKTFSKADHYKNTRNRHGSKKSN